LIWKLPGTASLSSLASVERMKYTLPNKPSIAVMPLSNLSGDKNLGYFCDGLADDIIDALSRSEYLFVIARNSTAAYKDKPVTVKQVARKWAYAT